MKGMRHNTGNRRRGHALFSARTIVCSALLVACCASSVLATRVADVTHLQGRRQNTLIGYGLVVGLQGTGDGGKYLPSIMQLQAMLSKFEIPVPVDYLKDTKNIAIVMVEAKLPENGAREGDAIDVRVSSVGASKSLVGGQLVPVPLQSLGLDGIFAFASGPVRIVDPKVKTNGVVKGGAVMEADVVHNYINELWEVTLVLEDQHASHALAATIAQMINENASEIGQVRRLARAVGPKNVVVSIPEMERQNASDFIGRIESTELVMPPGEARVVINRKTLTIAIGDGVEVGPAVISHKGMTITTRTPPRKPTREDPIITESHVAGIHAPEPEGSATQLQELVDALGQLNVPAKDIIEIIEQLHRLGKLTGKLVIVE